MPGPPPAGVPRLPGRGSYVDAEDEGPPRYQTWAQGTGRPATGRRPQSVVCLPSLPPVGVPVVVPVAKGLDDPRDAVAP